MAHPHFLHPCLQQHRGGWRLENASTGRVLAATLLTAFDRRSRNQGLLGRDTIDRDAALVLAPCAGVHTWFMRFPLDILFVSRQGRVLGVRRHVAPWRLAIRLGAFAVVELAAGLSVGTHTGHQLTVSPSEHT